MNVQLSEKQREIVEQPPHESIQVLASAGSGKTRVLTERIRFILASQKEDGAIALTFTNKAASEMKERLPKGDSNASRVWIGTIHSIAQRIIERYGHTVGLPPNIQIFERDKDRMEVFIEALRSDGVDMDKYFNANGKKKNQPEELNLQNYMHRFSMIKRDMLSEEDVSRRFPNDPGLWRAYDDYQNALTGSRGMDYDDILRYGHRILLEQSWVGEIYRSRYSHMFVDEAQDLNRIQYEFVKVLAGPADGSIMMVGDPDQMIYGFNGSSSEYLCERFITDFRPKEFRLTENYRSSRAIVRVANHLRPGALTETDFALEGEVRVYPLPSEEEEANRILSIVIKLMEAKHHPDIEGDISVDNMAVTARNRFVFSALEAALKEQNINYKLKVGEREKMPASFFGRALDSALRVKINPNDWVAGRKLCHILEIPAPAEWGNADLFDHFRNCLNQAKGVHNVLANELLDQINSMDLEEPNILNFEEHFKTRITEFAVAESDDEKKLEFDRSLEELQEFSGMWIRFRELGLGNTLGAFRNAMALGRLSPELPDDGLTLSTVHSMKGLEKDIVFLMGFCEGIFPDYRANTKAEIDEERNTAFVAVTRARRLLYITYPRSRVMPWGSPRRQSPSQFIAEMNLA